MISKIKKKIRIILWKLSLFLNVCAAESNLNFADEKIFDEVFDTFSENSIQKIKTLVKQYIYVITDDKIKERVRKIWAWDIQNMDVIHETKIAWLMDFLSVIDYKIQTSKRNV